jgi:hypothetical protein
MSLFEMKEKESDRRVSPAPSVRSSGSEEKTSSQIAPIAVASWEGIEEGRGGVGWGES